MAAEDHPRCTCSHDHGAPFTDEILREALTEAGVGTDPRLKLLRRFLKAVCALR